ncbi:hypothetical protein C8Q78DRAFT_30051 [Trametes maxima]|nr:hypothetical protein C8Q78DRAFT_30051 [Trametes maxima]
MPISPQFLLRTCSCLNPLPRAHVHILFRWITAIISYSGSHLLLSVRSAAVECERLDLTLLCAQASDDTPHENTVQSSKDPLMLQPSCSCPLPPRVSLQPREGESVRLVDFQTQSTSEQHTEESCMTPGCAHA